MSRRDFLEEIVARRRENVAEQRAASGFSKSRAKIDRARHPHRLRTALQQNSRVNIIGEFKRASPSLGVIRADADPAETAARYEQAGLCALSILTEPNYFRGSMDDLRQARGASELPILRKDFIVDELQIYEAAAAADAVLLIVAVLSDRELLEFRSCAEDDLGLDALVEVHTADEMRRATDCGARLIGVNNRDLHTFVTSIQTSLQLAELAPANATLVSESGISSGEQIRQLRGCGYRGVLLGESLMRSDDPAALIRSLSESQRDKLHHA